MTTDVQSPYISVVIPVYNGENYLRDAIDSVLDQTYQNYELLVIDDGSTDDTWNIISSYGDKIKGFHKENGGVSTALNYAIRIMNGEWFAWLSHDDLWVPEKLEKQVAWMKNHSGYAMYYSGSCTITPLGETILSNSYGTWYPRGKDLRKMIRPGCYISGITVLISKKCLLDVGIFDEKYRCVQDTDMWFRIASKYEISCLPEVLAKTRVHEKQIGITASQRCKKESISRRLKVLSATPLHLLYPYLNNPQIPGVIKFILLTKGFLYVKYTQFCLIHDIPTLLHSALYIETRLPCCIKRILEQAYHTIMYYGRHNRL